MASAEEQAPVVVTGRSRWPGIVLGAVLAVVALTVAGKVDLVPSLPNPFATRTIDRSQPPFLESLEDISRFEAASANFQVMVDNEKDTRFVPSIIKGERTVYLASGSVAATVDFGALDRGSVQILPDGSVTIQLPAPVLSEPRVDPSRSRVVSRDRGLLDRVGSIFSDNPTSERELNLAAQDKMASAAAASDLRTRAEQNTRAMLEGLLRSLGYDDVTVTFAASPT